MALTREDAIKKITLAMLETIDEAGDLGAPGGALYLAMMEVNVDLSSFQIYMSGLVRLGFLTHRHDCYHITDKGQSYIRSHTKPLDGIAVAR
jgi:predicted transcriptional regulator